MILQLGGWVDYLPYFELCFKQNCDSAVRWVGGWSRLFALICIAFCDSAARWVGGPIICPLFVILQLKWVGGVDVSCEVV